MPHSPDHLEQFANLDLIRAARTGIPEVVLAERKSPAQTVAIVERLLGELGRALVSRVPSETLAALEQAIGESAVWTRYAEGRTLAFHRPGFEVTPNGGHVGVLTAGTSDIPVAEEALLTARMMGNRAEPLYDVGVAGIHRLLEHRESKLVQARVIICVAGMEGALPSVVGGLVAAPVIAVPTSVGYGASFGGIAALLGMLNSCASNVTVVNIDNGFGAACVASCINRL